MNTRGKLFFTVCLTLAAVFTAKAQLPDQDWKRFRHEFSLGAGASNFLGELGGRDRTGSDFLSDLEISQTRYVIQGDYRFYLTPKLSLRTSLWYGRVAGNDNLTNEPFRRNRNLHFRSDIFEGALNFEWMFYSFTGAGARYGLRDAGGKRMGARFRSYGFYAFGGIGGFYFNPKANYNGSWIALRPLRTEGQGLPEGPEMYSRFSMAFPVGGGFRFGFSPRMSLSLELSYHFTLTDYIDDVSGVYYNNAAIRDNFGDAAAHLADPSLGEIPSWVDGHYVYNATGTGQQRGDSKDKDGFMFVSVTFNYKLKTNPKVSGSVKKTRKLRKRRTLL